MQSIKPKLGPGLGENKDNNRGIILPKLKMKNGKSFDDKFLYPFALFPGITSSATSISK